MKTAIFYDTETTGLPLFNQPSEHPDQPHICQLAAVMMDLDTNRVLQTLDVIIKPDGWIITEEVTAIHGVSQEMAMDIGVSESVATLMLLEMIGDRLRVAHNEQFDARILRIAVKRFLDDEKADQWKAGISECTAILTTPICKLPPTPKMVAVGMNKNKTPNLTEAYTHFFGQGFSGAHSAITDALACRDVYVAVKNLSQS